jgi:hypothetical protein
MWKFEQEGELFSVVGPEHKFWAANKADAEWLTEVLDEATNTVVKLHCQNKLCKGFGGFITRTAQDAKKTMYVCDECGKPMMRLITGASEKQTAKQVEIDVSLGRPQTPGQSPLPMSGRPTREHIATIMGQKVPAAPVVPTTPVPAAIAAPVADAAITALKAKVAELEVQNRQLDVRVGKLEREAMAQAETFQGVMTAMESFMSNAGAQTAKD